MKAKLREEIMKKAVDRKLTCAAARKIAENSGDSCADAAGMKIKNGQLGCF